VVSDVMTRPVLTISDAATAREATTLMHARRVQHLVVTARDGRVAGVVSDADLRAAQPSILLVTDVEMREKALSLVPLRDVMTREPHTAAPETPVGRVLDHMIESKEPSIPVVDGRGQPVGILTGLDVVRLARRLLAEAGR
jgi:CBS domain-containing protein